MEHASPEQTASNAASDQGGAMPGFVFFLLGWLVVQGGVVGFLLRPVLPGGWATVVGLGALLLFPVFVLIRGFSGVYYPTKAVRIWMLRPFWYTFMALPFLALSGLVGVLVGLPFGAGGAGGRWAVALTAGVLLVIALWGYVGSRRLRVHTFEARLKGLPAALDGLRIVQLTDLHVGPHTREAYLRRIVREVEAARPDLIVHTGDQVDDYAHDVRRFGDVFGGLRAPLGAFAVAGNHDVYAGWRAVREGMEAAGLRVLVNDAVELTYRDARFWIAGTGDPAGRHWPRGGGPEAAPDIERTLARVPPDAFTVALAHNPALWPDLAERGVDLTLSGHTHHGQFSVPRLGWSVASLFLDLAMGTHRRGDALLYIAPGTNYWGLPLRIGAWPEVTVCVLRPA